MDRQRPDFFAENGYASRAISGQTTSQMLVRFRADVVELHPQVAVICGGTNDLAQNTGYISLEHILDNIQSMAELARANGIRPVLCWCSRPMPSPGVRVWNRRRRFLSGSMR
ncbi:MAG: GDSL-type esterase/lipase family protein [Alistipes shahii]